MSWTSARFLPPSALLTLIQSLDPPSDEDTVWPSKLWPDLHIVMLWHRQRVLPPRKGSDPQNPTWRLLLRCECFNIGLPWENTDEESCSRAVLLVPSGPRH